MPFPLSYFFRTVRMLSWVLEWSLLKARQARNKGIGVVYRRLLEILLDTFINILLDITVSSRDIFLQNIPNQMVL